MPVYTKLADISASHTITRQVSCLAGLLFLHELGQHLGGGGGGAPACQGGGGSSSAFCVPQFA